MGMFSKMLAATTAQRLEKILIEAIQSGNDGVKEFAKKHLYEWYLDECGESWGYVKSNPEIEQAFENTENKLRPEDCLNCDKVDTEYCKTHCINMLRKNY